jgi:hypothetical protein
VSRERAQRIDSEQRAGDTRRGKLGEETGRQGEGQVRRQHKENGKTIEEDYESGD